MTARTFGKKRLEGEGGGDEIAARREAFIAAERARADRIAESDIFSPAGSALRASFAAQQPTSETATPEPDATVEQAAAVPFVPLERSLPVTYALWLGLGLAGGHRFYLARPLTGALQAVLFIASVTAVALQYYPAFAGLFLCWLWFFTDGLRIRKMFQQVTGK
ncbi:MAG TPA: hypothetical protein VIT38_14845 [Allosphingosinicella sp.]